MATRPVTERRKTMNKILVPLAIGVLIVTRLFAAAVLTGLA